MIHTDLNALHKLSPLASELQQNGYLIIENAMSPATLERLYSELDPHFAATPFGVGPFYGEETKRFGRVLMRSATAQQLALDPQVFSIVREILEPNCESLQLNLTQAIEIYPDAPAQVPHRDHDMWRTPKGAIDYMINVMWALDDFTLENGATRIWPGSNHTDQNEILPDEAAISAVMPRGSACLFLGSTLHSGGANYSNRPRRGLIMSYCHGWLKPWENQWLAYPPEVARTFHPELAALVGYQQHLPSLGNFEGQCPSVLLREAGQAWSPFVDALREDQQEIIRQYNRMQAERRAAA